MPPLRHPEHAQGIGADIGGNLGEARVGAGDGRHPAGHAPGGGGRAAPPAGPGVIRKGKQEVPEAGAEAEAAPAKPEKAERAEKKEKK